MTAGRGSGGAGGSGVPRVPGVTPPSRTNRNERRERSRRAEAVVTVLVVLLAGVFAWSRTRVDRVAAAASPSAPASEASPGSGQPRLAVLSITGGAGPMILVFGSAGTPVAISFPQDLTQVVPGQGETTLDDLGAADGPTVRVAVSNTLGVWVAHYGVASVGTIAKAVDAAGGLWVDLGRAFTANGVSVGPGKVKLTGAQVTAFLGGPKTASTARWGSFSVSLLTQHLPLSASAFVQTDDAGAMSQILGAAQGAQGQALPVTNLGGFVEAPDLHAIDAMAARELGASNAPIPVIVENGNGVPGVGARVAERLIPAGFRVVLSTNAESFSVRRTAIIALGGDAAGAAGRVRRALGTGKVTVSSVPSGVGDVKIIVGKDFK